MTIAPTLEAERAAPELLSCPFCGDHAETDFIEGESYIIECYACDASTGHQDCAEDAIAAWNRRTAAPVAEDVALPPIEYNRDMDRTYIPLPGGWEIQTKGNGSTFRIAHGQSRTRWMVLDDDLHEPLEAMARDIRAYIDGRTAAAPTPINSGMEESK